MYALKKIVQAGVRVFFYLEDRERTLDSPTDKIMLSPTAFADELEREKARQRTYDAMQRKAKAGHVTGGRVFGYDNVPVLGPGGERSHVTLAVNDAEAAVVRQILRTRRQGRRAEDHHPSPQHVRRAHTQGATRPPRAWAPSSVREVLHRELYRGRRQWNRTRKRDNWGQKRRRDRPAAEWIVAEVDALRIVPEELWSAAQTQMQIWVDRYSRFRAGADGGQPDGRARTKVLPQWLRPVRRVRRLDAGRLEVLVRGPPVPGRLRYLLEPRGLGLWQWPPGPRC